MNFLLPFITFLISSSLISCSSNIPLEPSSLTTRNAETNSLTASAAHVQYQEAELAALKIIEKKVSFSNTKEMIEPLENYLEKYPNNQSLQLHLILAKILQWSGSQEFALLKNLAWFDFLNLGSPISNNPANLNSQKRIALDDQNVNVLTAEQVQQYLQGNHSAWVSQMLNPSPKEDLSQPYGTVVETGIDLDGSLQKISLSHEGLLAPFEKRAIQYLDSMIEKNASVTLNLSNTAYYFDGRTLGMEVFKSSDFHQLKALLYLFQFLASYQKAYPELALNDFYNRLKAWLPILGKYWADKGSTPLKIIDSLINSESPSAPYLNFDAQKVSFLIGAKFRPNNPAGWLQIALAQTWQSFFNSEKSWTLQNPAALLNAEKYFRLSIAEWILALQAHTSEKGAFGFEWLGWKDLAWWQIQLNLVSQSLQQKQAVQQSYGTHTLKISWFALFDPNLQKDLRATVLPDNILVQDKIKIVWRSLNFGNFMEIKN